MRRGAIDGVAAGMVAAALALAPLASAAAQASSTRGDDAWRFSLLFYPSYDGLEGLSGAITTAYRRPPRRGPIPTTASFEITGRASTSGTRAAQVALDAPGLWPRWRLLGIAGADRLQRAPYFGLGNTPHDSTPDSRTFYRYSLLRFTLLGTVQRDVLPHVRVLAGVQTRHYRALPLTTDTTLLARNLATGVVADTGSRTGVELRGGLLYDTRDEEATPSRGVFLEALVGRGTADFPYTRYALGARAFVPLGEMTVLGVRQSVELADRAIPFYVMYERLTSWRPEDGFGGPTTLRATLPGRFLAPNRAVFSLDLRYKKIDVPIPTSPFRIWLLGFADAGRLWLSGESPDLGDLQWDAGVGAYAQFSKGSLFGLNIGVSRVDGFEFGSAVSFAF